jgi:hypothetical protein
MEAHLLYEALIVLGGPRGTKNLQTRGCRRRAIAHASGRSPQNTKRPDVFIRALCVRTNFELLSGDAAARPAKRNWFRHGYHITKQMSRQWLIWQNMTAFFSPLTIPLTKILHT